VTTDPFAASPTRPHPTKGVTPMHRTIVRSPFVLAAVLAVLALAVGPVAARTTPFAFTYDVTDEPDTSCGFLVLRDDVGTARGRAGDGRFDLTNAGVATLTNPENGLFVTQTYQVLFKNRNQVVDENGILSVDNTAVGPSTLSAPDGTVLLRNHGPIRVHLVIDLTSDTLISREVTFEHGAHDGYCETLAAALHFDV
jgi:hypothetical protein